MPDSPLAEPASTRRLGHPSVAPAAGPVPLTRAELRRRAKAQAELAAEAGVPVEILPELSPESVPVAQAAAALGAETAPPTASIPARRSRVRPAAPVDADEPIELLTPLAVDTSDAGAADASDLPVVAASAVLVTDEADEAAADAARAAAADAAAGHDAFAAAAKLFSFTGETPVQVAASALAEEQDAPAPVEPTRRRRGVSFRRVATASFSIGVVGAVGLLTVGMTTPLEAVAAAQGSGTSAVTDIVAPAGDVDRGDAEIQAYIAPADVRNADVPRADSYQAATIADLAAESGISNFSSLFVNDPHAPIQWPFAVGVPISYGFGMRSGSMHEGLDFTPGEGSPVQAIADGTVRIATESGGAFGVTVLIDHVIDGELVSSRYAHMEYGSLQVEQGQTVTVGTFLGRTGNTGRSFGAHTHFEILAGGTTPIDPMPWLREHTGG